MPKEFTPEISEDFYKRLASRIQERGVSREGQAIGEALERGRSDDPYLAASVGSARAQTSGELADLEAKLAYDVAGLGRQERLIGEEREFGSAEAEKERAFREQMMRLQAQLGGEEYGRREALQNRRGYQSALWNLGAGLAGSYLGGPGGGALAGLFSGGGGLTGGGEASPGRRRARLGRELP